MSKCAQRSICNKRPKLFAVASGPKPTSKHVLQYCGAARRTSHSLQPRNVHASELTVCGQNRHWIFQIRWRSNPSHLLQPSFGNAAAFTKRAIQVEHYTTISNLPFVALWLDN
jgi:hypothetical protein